MSEEMRGEIGTQSQGRWRKGLQGEEGQGKPATGRRVGTKNAREKVTVPYEPDTQGATAVQMGHVHVSF